ncbi:carboxypeptidase-like regulatory domain-containing protein [Flavobacterium sp.]|uniref:carboxypeptidase-like regulatory domain-containing protein n=1 Tax=Flavobacterium sp. TaxID=239 RepID=UPI001B647732|nr:carboxypeptidase-like regulatory domain-containing protein [Flavobacterium sp.]MBP6127753.1 hypothetical protein [Flavobacterium sp.]
MRQTTTIFFIFLFWNVYGQKWHLSRIDKSAKFNYVYFFQFDNKEDTSSFNFEKKAGNLSATIQLTDNRGDTDLFASIVIKGLDNDTLLYIITDLYGLGTVKLKPGNYRIKVSSMNYEEFSYDFTISEGEYFDLKIKLGLAPELDVYQINAKNELNEQEIQSIINCVKTNRQDFHKKCSDKDRYNISIQI